MTLNPCLTTSADKDVVLAFLREAYAYHGYGPVHLETEERVGRLLASPDLGVAWLLKIGDEAIGLMILTFGFDLEFGGRIGVLTDIYLVERHRRKGLGTAAIHFAESFCRAMDLRCLELQVDQGNTGALAFYQSLGFRSHDRIPMSKRVYTETVTAGPGGA